MPVKKNSRLNKKGQEVPDSTPVEVPVRFRENVDIHQRLKDYVRSEVFAMKMEDAGFETEEEANDFAVEEEFDEPPMSAAERASLMAEEMDAERADLFELEGQAKKEVSDADARFNRRRDAGDSEGDEGSSESGEGVEKDEEVGEARPGAAVGRVSRPVQRGGKERRGGKPGRR